MHFINNNFGKMKMTKLNFNKVFSLAVPGPAAAGVVAVVVAVVVAAAGVAPPG